MGVPAFFRWLTSRYPNALEDVVPKGQEGHRDPEIDNLYLDCNGIIHPCCHPEGEGIKKPGHDEDEMMQNVTEYLDFIVALTPPRKLLFLAIDGVAPRAKMNQQRSRRFCAARERREMQDAENDVRERLIAEGRDCAPPRTPSWDHNVITPGTAFMAKVHRLPRCSLPPECPHTRR